MSLSQREAQRLPVSTSALVNWVSGHDPDELWEPWRAHLRGQRVLIEHTSINPVHPLHVGSMRGTVIGSTLVELPRKSCPPLLLHGPTRERRHGWWSGGMPLITESMPGVRC